MYISHDIQLAQLLDMNNPYAVLEEVKCNFIHYYPIYEFAEVRLAFSDFIDLMDGNYPGYRRANTKFHDKKHTTDALLAISRLIDGYNIDHAEKLKVHMVKLALIATIFHDAGYVQTINDVTGTGAKYTLSHVDRSINFIKKYYPKLNFTKKDFESIKNMISCTGLNVNLSKIKFSSEDEKILGYMLGTADLIGQMSARTYLEKLLHLYKEFKEANIKGYESEVDLLKKTIGFYKITLSRLKKDLHNVQRYVLIHFQIRYKINRDLYQIAIDRQINYLKKILETNPQTYKTKLKREK
jgi:hypothetical protein